MGRFRLRRYNQFRDEFQSARSLHQMLLQSVDFSGPISGLSVLHLPNVRFMQSSLPSLIAKVGWAEHPKTSTSTSRHFLALGRLDRTGVNHAGAGTIVVGVTVVLVDARAVETVCV